MKTSKRNAFTLIELLVVIAIIGVLVGLTLPAVQQAREAARRMACSNNTKQLCLSVHNYIDAHKHFPAGGLHKTELCWLVDILPFIEKQTLHDEFSFADSRYTDEGKNENASNRVDMFLCPSQPEVLGNLNNNKELLANGQQPYTSHYNAIMGPRGTNLITSQAYPYDSVGLPKHGGFAKSGCMFKDSKVRVAEITDGLTQTSIIGEVSWTGYSKYRTWVRGWSLRDDFPGGTAMGQAKNVFSPISKNVFSPIKQINTGLPSGLFNDGAFGSEHPGGAIFGFADGSNRLVSEQIEDSVFFAMASRNGRE